MRYEEVQKLPRAQFKRLCGVMPETFEWMIETLQQAQKRKKLPGRPNKLSLENQLLLTLQYWREYQTTFTSPPERAAGGGLWGSTSRAPIG